MKKINLYYLYNESINAIKAIEIINDDKVVGYAIPYDKKFIYSYEVDIEFNEEAKSGYYFTNKEMLLPYIKHALFHNSCDLVRLKLALKELGKK